MGIRYSTSLRVPKALLISLSGQVWSSYSVLNVLYSLIQKSKINEHIVALQQGKSKDEIKSVTYE
jgi:translation initiation factor 3 subunit L